MTKLPIVKVCDHSESCSHQENSNLYQCGLLFNNNYYCHVRGGGGGGGTQQFVLVDGYSDSLSHLRNSDKFSLAKCQLENFITLEN